MATATLAPPAEPARMNIVFDFGGVLFDWRPHEFMARLLPAHAHDEASARALVADVFQGYGGAWSEFDRGTIAPGPLALRIAERTGLHVDEAALVIASVPHELQPIPATVALLQRLAERGHALYFLSNMPAPYADHLDATHAFLGVFRAGVYSARVKLIKPEPAIFAHAQAEFGIDPANTLFIDDLAHNAAAAQAAGWQAVHFESAAQCEAALHERGLL
jgi:putative hydrolase of the HAD superfamily